MSGVGLEAQVTAVLRAMNTAGGYPMSLVCTDRGLLIAAAGEQVRSEVAAGLTGLFADIVARAARDLEFGDIDELSLSDGRVGRFVVRLLARERPWLFLVAQVPRSRYWRRNTTTAARGVLAIMQPLMTVTHHSQE